MAMQSGENIHATFLPYATVAPIRYVACRTYQEPHTLHTIHVAISNLSLDLSWEDALLILAFILNRRRIKADDFAHDPCSRKIKLHERVRSG